MNMDINGNELTINGTTVMLRKKQMAVFNHLRLCSPRVIETDDLKERMKIMSTHTVVQHISQLRQALSVFKCVCIVTHSRVGYALKIIKEQ